MISICCTSSSMKYNSSHNMVQEYNKGYAIKIVRNVIQSNHRHAKLACLQLMFDQHLSLEGCMIPLLLKLMLHCLS